MIRRKRMVAGLAVAAMCVTTVLQAPESEAAKKPALSKKKVTMTVGKTSTVKVKNAKKAKITWKSNKKKVATARKSGKYGCKITAKKSGNAVIICKVKIGRKSTTLKCKVTVKKKTGPVQTPAVSEAPQVTPGASAAASTQTPQNTLLPTASADASSTQTPTDAPGTQAPTDVPGTQAPTDVPGTPAPTNAPEETFVPVIYKTATFENGDEDFVPRGGSETISVVEDGYEGKCLFVEGRSQAWQGAKINVADTIVPGAKYQVTAYMKHMAGEPAEIKCSGQMGETYPEIAVVKDAESGVWTKLEGVVEIPAIITDYIIYFEVPGSATADFYLDNIEITQISAPKEPEVLTSIRETYKDIFPYMGTCVNYNGWRAGKQLQTQAILGFVKEHFNSISLEDEMKPDAVLGRTATKLTVEEAKAKDYVIPDNYTEEYVPQLNFDTLDRVLEICNREGLKMRAHTLMWHQQTPAWFFAENYNGSTPTTPEIMDARLEFYVRTVMKHMMDKEKELTGSNGDIVYAWDVTNEYLHRNNDPSAMSWVDVYGDLGMEPTYVKKAFELAYDMLKQYGVQDKVVLFNNDYNTYFEVEEMIALVNYINEGEEAKICGGIGMQSHIDVERPTLEEYGEALDQFLATGLEVQITELDITINFVDSDDLTDEDQAAFMKDFMEMVIMKQKNRNTAVSPKGITGITLWGLYDTVSWRGSYGPLLFGTSIYDPKPSYYTFIEAAQVWNQ